ALSVKPLANSLLAKQAVSLLKRLNSTSQVEVVTKLWIRQGILKECIMQNICQHHDASLSKRSWRSNVAINTIKQCKKLVVIFDMPKDSWRVQGNGSTIISKLNNKLKKQSKQA
ncbi:13166_t:CDS:1, partial [Gigaspora rosea]